MFRLIINADDLGISQEVNEAIAECFAMRFITSTTLMVNKDYADEAVEMARKYGWHERVGLHLNFTSGMPLTEEIRKCRRFCSKDGSFNAEFFHSMNARLHMSGQETLAARIEAEAQIRKYISYGLPDKHLDSHHYVHTDLSIWNAVEPLVEKYGIRSVRLTRNLYKRMSLVKKIYKNRFNRRLRALPIQTADYFGSFKDFMHCKDRIEDGSLTEIMVHPMYNDEGILTDTAVPVEEEREYLSRIRYVKEFY